MNKLQAQQLLQTALANPAAEFRDGQWEAIDDIIDSGWTLAVLAALLQQAGSGIVYPATLATSSVKDA